MVSEDRPAISSSRLSATEVARHTFATVRRGLDPSEVRSFLEAVARELSVWEQREQELRDQVAAAEERARHPVLDEATITAALGQQSAQVLRHAHDEAARVVAQAEEQAAATLRQAHQSAADLTVEAEGTAAARIAEADLAAAALEARGREAAEAMLDSARAEGEAVVERAREQGRAVLTKVQDARREVLADLARRRKALHLQIEQFRAARDEIAATVLGVRDSVDAIVADLGRADENARAAAQDVARRGVEVPDLPGLTEVLESGLDPAAEGVALDDVAVEVEVEVAVAGDGDAEAPERAVDELFARLRAAQPDGGEPGDAGTEEDPGPGPAPDEAVVVVEELVVVEPVEVEAAGGEGPAELSEEDEDEVLVALRASVLDPVVAALARRLKRVMADDQNRLLDRLRGGSASADDLLAPEDEQCAPYQEATATHLREALQAGAAFGGGSGADGGAVDPTLADTLATELGREVVQSIRRRLLEEGEADLGERVGAAFREWRGERIERLVGDRALSAFSAGVLAGAGDTRVRWILAGGDGGCADCDDNSLADPVAPGEEFPTGHRHPPAHAGCRCLVAPTSA